MNQSMQAMYKVTSLFSTPGIEGVDSLTSQKSTQDPNTEGAVQGKNVNNKVFMTIWLQPMYFPAALAFSTTFAGCSFLGPMYLFCLVMVKVYQVHTFMALLKCIAMHLSSKANYCKHLQISHTQNLAPQILGEKFFERNKKNPKSSL